MGFLKGAGRSWVNVVARPAGGKHVLADKDRRLMV
jgi:hypothetical protein